VIAVIVSEQDDVGIRGRPGYIGGIDVDHRAPGDFNFHRRLKQGVNATDDAGIRGSG
jgi:hypothetical protein